MSEFLKHFWAWAVSLAGLVGLYLAAEAGEVVWAFWLVLGIAVVLAGGPKLGSRLLEVGTRVRNYPVLLRRVAELEGDVAAILDRDREMRVQADHRWSEGVAEGRAQVLGALASGLVRHPPKLISTSVASGAPILVAQYPDDRSRPAVGARFRLEVEGTRELKGVVEVSEVREEDSLVLLTCVDRASPEFWERLAHRAVSDPAAPSAVQLTSFSLPREISAPNAMDPEDAS